MATYEVKGTTFESAFSNSEAALRLAQGLHDKIVSSTFAASLITQYTTKRVLSSKQWAWVHKFACDLANGDKIVEYKPTTLQLPFIEILGAVAENSKYVYRVRDVQIQLAIAGPNSKHRGSINVTDGQGYANGRWFGRIVKEEKLATFVPAKDCNEAVYNFVKIFGEDPITCVATYATR